MRKKEKGQTIEHSTGSDNIFRDLGLENADDLLVKSDLTILINQIIRKRKLTRAQAAKIMRIDQADASRLLNCRLTRFSIERLFNILNNLGYAIEIHVTDAKAKTVKSRAKSKPIVVVEPESAAALLR